MAPITPSSRKKDATRNECQTNYCQFTVIRSPTENLRPKMLFAKSLAELMQS